jgi:hypothetical protein
MRYFTARMREFNLHTYSWNPAARGMSTVRVFESGSVKAGTGRDLARPTAIRRVIRSRQSTLGGHIVIADHFHSVEMGHPAASFAILVGERQGLRLARYVCNPY